LTVTIVKMGGSLAHSRAQREGWLSTLAACGRPLIVTPGGGPFAAAVRAAQTGMGFDDRAAHWMALLAMEQYGVALAAFSEVFSLAASISEMESILQGGGIPVWLPSRMVLPAIEVPASWDATSDSLSAWLAAKMGARRLLLIKSCDCSESSSVEDLAMDDIVDPLFPLFAGQAGVEVFIAGPAALASALDILRGGGMPGAVVDIGVA
jgi:dihydroneopterin aldolase